MLNSRYGTLPDFDTVAGRDMLNEKKCSKITQKEIDALRKGMEKGSTDIDRFFLLKVHAAMLLCLFASSMMLFFPQKVTYWVLARGGH